jgi:hypothetical protein
MWSKKYKKCIFCGTTDSKHSSKGLCAKCNRRKWKEQNLEEYKRYSREYYKENSEKIKKRSRAYYKTNSEKIKKYAKKYKEKDPEKYTERTKKWREENPIKFKKQRSDYWKKRSGADIHFKLRNTVSCLIRKRLRFHSSSKNGKSTFSFLPYSVNDLVKHLENLFQEGMTWKNYGKWHIDHKIPDCKFDYKFVSDKEFQECWALKNLQPLWAKENIKKGGK